MYPKTTYYSLIAAHDTLPTIIRLVSTTYTQRLATKDINTTLVEAYTCCVISARIRKS